MEKEKPHQRKLKWGLKVIIFLMNSNSCSNGQFCYLSYKILIKVMFSILITNILF